MATLNNFDANQVDPSVALDPLPAGKYLAVVSESELKPTKTGVGKYLPSVAAHDPIFAQRAST